MTCFHPLIRYEYGEKYRCNDGHLAYKASVTKLEPGSNYEDKEEFAKYLEGIGKGVGKVRKTQIIPCGKCIGCRLEYSKQWATKGIYEAEQYDNNWFLTITYDQDHLPEADNMIDPETGADLGINPYGTLKSQDLTLFIKKLRMYYERTKNHKGIRYMACGEYGEIGNRPHYHAIMFNLPIPKDQLKFHEYNDNYEPLFRCPELEKIWGKGMIVAAEVNWNTCAYTARYITKKVGIPTEDYYYKCIGVEPEFFRMSRRPGIGRQYYEEHKEEIYKNDQLLIQKYGGGLMKVKPPKYYDKLYDAENHEEFEKLRKLRKKDAERITNLQYIQSTLLKKESLENQEITKNGQTSTLKRRM